MAFSSTVTAQMSVGSRRKVWGTYTMATLDVGGTIDTNLKGVTDFAITQTDTVASRSANRFTSESTGTLTLTIPSCRGAETGIWYAIGH